MTSNAESTTSRVPEWIAVLIAAALTAIAFLIVTAFDLDIQPQIIVGLLALMFVSVWIIWRFLSTGWVRIVMSIAALGAITGLAYYVVQSSKPSFEITALKTLDGDPDAYELTDMLIWNRDNLGEYDVEITFTLQIVPDYQGNREFGKVIAVVSGDGSETIERTLWLPFDRDSQTVELDLTLPQVLSVTGLEANASSPENRFLSDAPLYQQSYLDVQIVRVAAPATPWCTKRIVFRNAPWDVRADLMWRNNRHEADVYLRNLGGKSGFTVLYHLAHLDRDLEPGGTHLMHSGATQVAYWNEPSPLVELETGEYFTATISLPEQLDPGRYIFEAYPIKKQQYISFEDPKARWEDINTLKSEWWFGSPSQRLPFLVPLSEPDVPPQMEEERERLRKEREIDLGPALTPTEDLTSHSGTRGQHQVFENGDIYVHDGQSYALYGSILEHYRKLGGHEHELLGFPTSPIEDVWSGPGGKGTMMEFEGHSEYDWPARIYASWQSTAAMWGLVGQSYLDEHGGHDGWLGFPIADEWTHSDSVTQKFEGGYVVWYYPWVGGERDYTRRPVAFAYLASEGVLLDLYADQLWQDTGIQVNVGERLTIVQVGGTWTEWESSIEPHDANGTPYFWDSSEDATFENALLGTLIGKIGTDDRTIFPVGRWYERTCTEAGTLYLAMNDSYHEDNAGFVTVQITVGSSGGE